MTIDVEHAGIHILNESDLTELIDKYVELRAGIQNVLDDCEGHDALNSLYGIKSLRKLMEETKP